MKNRSPLCIAPPEQQPGGIEKKVSQLIHSFGLEKMLMSDYLNETMPDQIDLMQYTIPHPSSEVPNLQIIRQQKGLRVFLAEGQNINTPFEMKFALDEQGKLSYKCTNPLEHGSEMSRAEQFAQNLLDLEFVKEPKQAIKNQPKLSR